MAQVASREMSKLASLPTLLTLLATLALPGCRRSTEQENREEQAANAKKVTADSTDDATEPIVDESYQFRLTPPGEGWKLLREHDASSINPDAIAGAISSSGPTYGIVIVERLPGTTLEQAKELVWNNELTDLVVVSEVDLEFQGVPAKRREFTGSIEGQPIRFLSTIFISQDHLYQLMSWEGGEKQAGQLLRFHEAFELLDGEVMARSSARAPIVDADGVGWRIREGRYESALSELRVRPSAGWRFVIGTELEQLGSDSEIVLLHDQRNVYVALVVERVSKDRREALAQTARQLFDTARTAPATETFKREIAGRSVEFRRYDESPLGYVHGVYVGDEAIIQLTIWYPLRLAGEAATPLDELFAGIEELPADERKQLRQTLLGSAENQPQFSKDRAYRAGVFLDYEHRLRWTKPPGFWQINSFARAAEHSKETVLRAAELDLGIYVAIEAFPSEAEAGDALTNIIAGHELLSREVAVINGLSIYLATTVDHSSTPPTSYQIAAARRGDLMIVNTASSTDDSPAHRQAMTAAVAGLEFDVDLERTTVDDGVYHDLQHGFSFTIPAGLDRPEVTNLGVAQVAAWTQGKQELVSIFIIGVAHTDDEEWVTSYFEQILRDRLSAQFPIGKPTRSEGKLGVHPARHLSWKQDGGSVSADIVVRGPVVHCLLYVNLSDEQIQTVQSSWSLLE
jgi:hypothetical protein